MGHDQYFYMTIRKLVKGTYARHGGDNQVWYIMQADA